MKDGRTKITSVLCSKFEMNFFTGIILKFTTMRVLIRFWARCIKTLWCADHRVWTCWNPVRLCCGWWLISQQTFLKWNWIYHHYYQFEFWIFYQRNYLHFSLETRSCNFSRKLIMIYLMSQFLRKICVYAFQTDDCTCLYITCT